MIILHVCAYPYNKQKEGMVIYGDRKKTLNDRETLGVHDGECHLRVRRVCRTF